MYCITTYLLLFKVSKDGGTILMKKIFILLLLLVGSQQTFGMKRALRFPINPAKAMFTKFFTRKNYGEALTLAESCKDIGKNLFNSKEITIFGQQLESEIYTTNEEITKDMLNPLRENFGLILPASTALLTTTQDPVLLGLGVTGLTLGSLGLKKHCDYWINKMKYKSLVKHAEKFNEIFCSKEEKKEQELKTK